MKKNFYKQRTQLTDQLRKASDAKYKILMEISREFRQHSPSWGNHPIFKRF